MSLARVRSPLPGAFISHTSPQSQPFLMKSYLSKKFSGKICHALMRNNQSTNQCAAQSCSFTFTSSETMDFRRKACSKNTLERVDSRVQHRWRLRVIGSCEGLILNLHALHASHLPYVRFIVFGEFFAVIGRTWT